MQRVLMHFQKRSQPSVHGHTLRLGKLLYIIVSSTSALHAEATPCSGALELTCTRHACMRAPPPSAHWTFPPLAWQPGNISHAGRTYNRTANVKPYCHALAGSKSKKLQLLSLLPEVVALANKADSDRDELIQSAATLGSFAYGVDDGVRAVVAQGAVESLLAALRSKDVAVVEAAARSLKLIYRVGLEDPQERLHTYMHDLTCRQSGSCIH